MTSDLKAWLAEYLREAQRPPGVDFGAVSEEDAACLLCQRGPEWRAARAKILNIHPLDEKELVYGWKDHRGALRTEFLREAVNGGRISQETWRSIVAISSRYCHSEVNSDEPSNPDELAFTLVYDTGSPRHELVALPLHLAPGLSRGATTDRARAGLARLRQMTKLDARTLTFDLFVRRVLPEVLEPAAPPPGGHSGFGPGQVEHLGHADPAAEHQLLGEIAAELRALPPLPGSLEEVEQRLRRALFRLQQYYALEKTAELLASTLAGARRCWSLPALAGDVMARDRSKLDPLTQRLAWARTAILERCAG